MPRSRDSIWLNNDGLKVGFGTRTSENVNAGPIRTVGLQEHTTKVIYSATDIGAADNVAVQGDEVPIPAGSIITAVRIVVEEAFDSANDTATLDVGLKAKAGTEIDYDGLVAAATVAELAVGVVDDPGVLVGTRIAVDGYISLKRNVQAFTAGKAYIVVEYERGFPVA
jgi:hypothetical protein